jgi:sulfotransferase
MKTLHFITGLPRSGSTLLANILKQNPEIHGEGVSSLSGVFGSLQANWGNFEQNREYQNDQALKGVLKGTLDGYYNHIDKPVIFDKDRGWVSQIAQLEAVLDREVKMLVCVRNPAEIVTSFERLRNQNPLYYARSDQYLKDQSNIATRAYYVAGPEGPLGMSHRSIKDAITMGYLDRLLFVDYARFCNSPKSQTKRIYDFFELPNFEHDFNRIEQTEHYVDVAIGYKDLHKIKSSIQKTTVNCVQYIGLELYEQYNREVFWNAWI